MEDALSFPPPELTSSDAIEIGFKVFGIDADDAKSLGSERDQAFLIIKNKQSLGVLKISNAAQDAGLLELEELAALHVYKVNKELPIAIPMPTLDTKDSTTPLLRGEWEHNEDKHYVRCYPVMPGNVIDFSNGALSDKLLHNWGIASAKVSKALRSFGHPLAFSKVTPWDAQNALLMRPLLQYVDDSNGLRVVCEDVLNIFQKRIKPILPTLRHQVVHGDLNLGNALVSDNEEVSGIIDFGDMSYTAVVADIAAMLTGLGLATCKAQEHEKEDGTTSALLRMGRVLLDGFQSVLPLEDSELSILADLWMVRVSCEVILTSWRVGTGLESSERSEPETPYFQKQLRILYNLGEQGRINCLRFATNQMGVSISASSSDLVQRREQSIGPASEPLSYGNDPLVVDYATGCWVIDTNGKKYLDCYNNVPCVGHAHPRVALAIGRQAQKAVTNMRYLHPYAVTLAERLKSTLPPHLDTVFYVNSGSEANDLAWRMATSVTGGKGGLCTEHAYHGISEATVGFSPETAAICGHLPNNIERWAPPDSYRGTGNTDENFRAALERMKVKGIQPAMTILDGVMQSDGVIQLDAEYVKSLIKLTHEAGALWCADEVQGGHGRVGSHMWSFQKFDILPDFVTLGKPMGNGHPVAACITSRKIADQFVNNEGIYFSTFGGNPVSCAAAHAVLDVIQDENILSRCYNTGEILRKLSQDVSKEYDCVGEIRGRGLATGIEIVTDSKSKIPDESKCSAIKDALRRHGVLVGTAGKHCNVLKIRPPLAFTEKEAPLFAAAFLKALKECCGSN